MKFNPLIAKIYRHSWFLDPRQAINMGPFVHDLLAGSITIEEDKPPLAVYAISPTGLKIDLAGGPAENQESVFDNAPDGSVAFIPVKGTMLKEDTWCSYGTESIGAVMVEASRHKNISAVILEIDSGGGSVDSVPPMVDAIKIARENTPVISWADLAASAAYWTASESNLIIASNDISSEFGSIGVMMSFADVRPMWEKEGVKFHTIYAPESNYKNLPFEKALKGDYDLIKKEELSPLARKFQKSVRENRNGKVDITQKGILNGRMYFAQDAVKFGLADEIGNREYAIKRAVELAKKQ